MKKRIVLLSLVTIMMATTMSVSFVSSYEYANGNGETRLAAPSVMAVKEGTGFRPRHRHAPLFGGIPVTGKE